MKLLAFLFTFISIQNLVQAKEYSHIQLSYGMEKSFSNSLKRDFQIIKHWPFKNLAPETFKLFEIKTVEQLNDWAFHRVSYILKNTSQKNVIDRVLPLNDTWKYPSSEELPLLNIPEVEERNEGIDKNNKPLIKSDLVLMTNIGSPIYLSGKQQQILYGFKFRRTFFDTRIIPVISPRVGIIQVGEGLFHSSYQINKKNNQSLANTIQRVSTLFHEARHSDGHGKSLGFLHAPCPKGHVYQGLFACDLNLNGPYSVGATVAMEMIKTCDSCKTTEKEQLLLNALESKSRVVKTVDEELDIYLNCTDKYEAPRKKGVACFLDTNPEYTRPYKD